MILSPGVRVTEKQLQAQVVQLASLTGWRCYHTFDSRRSAPGFPDLLLVRPPRCLFVELKTTTGRLRPAQAAWLEALAEVEHQKSTCGDPPISETFNPRSDEELRKCDPQKPPQAA
jgi:hypothetical protein